MAKPQNVNNPKKEDVKAAFTRVLNKLKNKK